jgi:transposase
MIKITLSTPERQHLEDTFKTTTDRRLRDRCQAILMADRRRPHPPIAADLGVTARTLQRWLNAYHKAGVAGWQIQWAPGRTPCLPASLAPVILTWVKQGPSGCGLDRATWTYAELATYLYQTRGIAVSETTMRTFCTKHGVRPYRPTDHYLKGDTDAQKAACQALDVLKKKPPPGNSSC